jgi:hypothetical protein
MLEVGVPAYILRLDLWSSKPHTWTALVDQHDLRPTTGKVKPILHLRWHLEGLAAAYTTPFLFVLYFCSDTCHKETQLQRSFRTMNSCQQCTFDY